MDISLAAIESEWVIAQSFDGQPRGEQAIRRAQLLATLLVGGYGEQPDDIDLIPVDQVHPTPDGVEITDPVDVFAEAKAARKK